MAGTVAANDVIVALKLAVIALRDNLLKCHMAGIMKPSGTSAAQIKPGDNLQP